MAPRKFSGIYPPNWEAIAYRIKEINHWCCERCHHKHDSPTYFTLTVHHLDGNKGNIEDWNLAALCQRCHLHIEQFSLEALLLIYDSPGIFGNNEPWLASHIAGIKEAVLFGVSPARGEAIQSSSSSHHSNLLVAGARGTHTLAPF